MTSLVAVLLFVALFIVLGAWSTLAQARFFRLLRRSSGENLLLEGGIIQDRYVPRPWLLLRDAPGLIRATTRATNAPHSDPVVERARREYLFRRRVQWAVSGVAVLVLILYLNVLR